jgi:hypothetical protein
MSLEVMMVESERKRWVFPDAFKLEVVAAVRPGLHDVIYDGRMTTITMAGS